MSSNIIIDGYEQSLLINEIIKSKYGKSEYSTSEEINYELFDINVKSKIQDLFQMFIIYEKVIFPAVDPNYNLDELLLTGHIEYDTYDDMEKKLDFKQRIPEIDYPFSQYLKPLIIDSLCEGHRSFFKNTKDYTLKECCSIAYDYCYPDVKNKTYTKNNRNLFSKILDENLDDFKFRNQKSINATGLSAEKSQMLYITSDIASSVEILTYELQLSSEHDCPIIQSHFDFNKISYFGNMYNHITRDAYVLLKIECRNILGELPYIESFTQALSIKNKKKNEIKNLRSVLIELNYVLKEEGQEKAITKIVKDIHKAQLELTKGNPYKKVAKWTQFIAVPIAAAETLLQSQTFFGISIEAIGQLVEIIPEVKRRQNNWLEVFRYDL